MDDLNKKSGKRKDDWQSRIEKVEKKAMKSAGKKARKGTGANVSGQKKRRKSEHEITGTDRENKSRASRGKKRRNQNKKRFTQNNRLSFVKLGMIAAGLFVCIGIVLFCSYTFKRVESTLVVEAGIKYIEADQFLKRSKDNAVFITDISAIDLSLPGSYEVVLELEETGDRYTSQLVIKDTVPPYAEAVAVQVSPGTELSPEDFITAVEDATPVTVAFQKQPDFNKKGTQSVTIVLEDAGGNVKKVKSRLTVTNVRTSLQVEAGIQEMLVLDDFLFEPASDGRILSDISQVDLNSPGYFDVRIYADGAEHICRVEVVDTMAPQVTVKEDLVLWKGQQLDPESLIESYWDASEVQIYFLDHADPDLEPGEGQQIHLVLEDSYGNKTVVTAAARVLEDNQPPAIYGAENRTVYLEEKVAYRQGILVEDDSGVEIELEVDISQMDITRLGTYPVTYTAADPAGNTTSVTVEFTVVEKPEVIITEAEVLIEADRVLEEIIEEGMTLYEQVWAIYNWGRENIYYVNTSDKTNWYIGAYQGFTTLSGDCYNYFAVGKAMLERLGIENMDVVNHPDADVVHYWSMVNLGDGWYHLDLTPRKVDDDDFFLVTDAYLTEFSAENENSHDWDRDRYPETPNIEAVDNETPGISLSSLPKISVSGTGNMDGQNDTEGLTDYEPDGYNAEYGEYQEDLEYEDDLNYMDDIHNADDPDYEEDADYGEDPWGESY